MRQWMMLMVAVLPGALIGETYDFAAVHKFVQSATEAAEYEGSGMLVWKDGRVVFEAYFGDYQPETIVPIASATKWLSGAVVMSLVDDGLLALDDPLSRYLNEFSGDKSRITIRQAFSHTSGLGRVEGNADWRRATPIRRFAGLVAGEALEAQPGTELRYAGESMQVVGAVAEHVAGKRWEELFRERIAEPLGMTCTGYSRDGRAVNPLLAGGAGSCVRDYARFLQMLIQQGRFDGRQLLTPEAIRTMHANQVGDVPVTRASRDRSARQSRYGIGNWLDEVDAKGDSNQNSSPGAFGMRPWIDWDRNLFGIFFIDRRTAQRAADADVYDLMELVRLAVDDARPSAQPGAN